MVFEDVCGETVLRLALPTPTLPPASTTNTLIVVGERFAVIEPATPDRAAQAQLEQVIETLLANGHAGAATILTHHHGDHIAAAPRLRERFGLPILAHPLTAERLPFPIDRALSDEEQVDLGGRRLEAVWTPGHAPGHLVLVEPQARFAYAGDLVAGQGTIVIDPEDGGDMAAYLRSLEQIRGLGLDVLVPSHGDPIRDVDGFIVQLVAHRQAREAKIVDALERGCGAFDVLLADVYRGTPEPLMPWAARSLEAHLDKLVHEDRVVREGARLRLTS